MTAAVWLVTLLLAVHQYVRSLKCYSCSFSFNELYDLDHRDAWCANESLVLFDTDETAKSCAPWEKFCVVRDVNRYGAELALSAQIRADKPDGSKTAVNTINKAFTSVSRGCGERCSELCESVGYGHDQEK
ncbi:hypothetical protein ANCCAN_02415 [Ancylostoma caninum]|uniref:Protein quiver n=1 Tax=Ancylostoma caninum TaxID=29170 RepID=A0A368H4G0_ANCCA|nr:hypothetical protein ANCCAN_02415 [Ancylostoma caninum]